MLVPCTVTDAEPVAARFPRRIMLSPSVSTDHACVMLATRFPIVIRNRRVLPDPCPTRHLKDVSDSQSVPSHPVCPPPPLVVYANTPMLAPCTVTEADPVPARFSRRVTLRDPTSTENAADKLAPRSPPVITTRRVPPTWPPALHLTDVSDSQSVDSDAV